jgi:GIY-YIG catalytic domain
MRLDIFALLTSVYRCRLELKQRVTMPLLFNTLLDQAQISSLGEVRLLRHQDPRRSDRGRSPYELWRDDRPAFERYQEYQSFKNRNRLKASYWASFVVTPVGETLLAGFYACRYLGINKEDRPWPNNAQRTDPAGTCDIYELTPDDRLNDLAGRLVIEWGDGERTWIQRADNQNKMVLEIRTVFREPDFPGFADFIAPLSKIETLPRDWITALRSSRGIYLLTCPKTKEQYVGKASGDDGFYGRWSDYVRDGHGGNVGLKSRDPSDYQVSILQVAGDAETFEIDAMETRWKQKLQSREMGLNRN